MDSRFSVWIRGASTIGKIIHPKVVTLPRPL